MDPVTSARTAREGLARGLAALQTPGLPNGLASAIERVAQAMGTLHRIETSGGAAFTEAAPIALGITRQALSELQALAIAHPAVDQALEAIAGSLGIVHELTVEAMRAPVMPPRPQAPRPAASPPPAPERAPAPPAAVSPYAGTVVSPVHNAGAAPQAPPAPAATAVAPHASPTPPLRPAISAPGPAPAAPPRAGHPSPTGPARAHDATQPSPVWQGPPPGPPAVPVVVAQPAPAPAPAPPAAEWRAAPQPPRGPDAVPSFRIEAALGAHSPTNFYKGLSGNDVIESGGLFIATYRIPPVGTQVLMKVALPGGYEFDAIGVVRWTREVPGSGADVPPGFGAQFTHISPEARQLVYRYVRNREPLFHDDQ